MWGETVFVIGWLSSVTYWSRDKAVFLRGIIFLIIRCRIFLQNVLECPWISPHALCMNPSCIGLRSSLTGRTWSQPMRSWCTRACWTSERAYPAGRRPSSPRLSPSQSATAVYADSQSCSQSEHTALCIYTISHSFIFKNLISRNFFINLKKNPHFCLIKKCWRHTTSSWQATFSLPILTKCHLWWVMSHWCQVTCLPPAAGVAGDMSPVLDDISLLAATTWSLSDATRPSAGDM